MNVTNPKPFLVIESYLFHVSNFLLLFPILEYTHKNASHMAAEHTIAIFLKCVYFKTEKYVMQPMI